MNEQFGHKRDGLFMEEHITDMFTNVRGIILAGGSGSRLDPLTSSVNKCLLPMYDKPVIHWSVNTLFASGIRDIMIVCGGENAKGIPKTVGKVPMAAYMNINYVYQKEPTGVVDALKLAKSWAGDSNICVKLADNIMDEDFRDHIHNFNSGCKVFLAETKSPKHYGIAEMLNDKIIHIEEKPDKPKSNKAVIGLYLYDKTVWTYADKYNELTKINNAYIKDGKLKHANVGWWADCGESPETYFNTCVEARNIVLKKKASAI